MEGDAPSTLTRFPGDPKLGYGGIGYALVGKEHYTRTPSVRYRNYRFHTCHENRGYKAQCG